MNTLNLARRLAPKAARAVTNRSLLQQTNALAAFPSVQQPFQSFNFSSAAPPSLDELGSVDTAFYTDRVDKVAEPERRAFTYLFLSTARFAYASFARVAVVKFVSSMSASADVLALASAEFDVSQVPVGNTITVKWRGKPIFIKHRSSEDIATEEAVPMAHLRDQEEDAERYEKPEWLVVLGICTHLGCVPISNAGEYGGWFCPCHGSHYDTSGRIRKGPAPLNLEIPPYKFVSDTTIKIG
mmetsp:Transcript_37768/g.55645  ORF Transcript_37768/g.55645 Transcript_37768/m.55645 type:complete len:241 (+) Transcript_37768:75-797(+)|eukprot:CAMPEP_0195528368 /NCGR_PEP_ID=MMETSP0794_2-20130614/30470_1 /TAXON_ID=515487 /ORGANISM="Stephanopyxis turris, Strain CCMP 815" /LENGTH=240 /DNA_ID=CAMNT_0040659491 /DNA_START=63 /DNA_END=785 /DNA_ORIENTATION=+